MRQDEPTTHRIVSDRQSLVSQARERLVHILDEGGYQAGTKLPSERVLASELGISRPTLREALRLLEEEGRIVRQPGLGNFAQGDGMIIDAGLEQLMSFTEMMTQAGYEPGCVQLKIERGSLSEIEARALLETPGNPKYFVKRVRTLNGVPAGYMEHVIPALLVGDLTEAEAEGSIYEAVENRTGSKIAYAEAEIYPALAGEAVANILGLTKDAVLLVLDEIIYNARQIPVMLALTYFRPDLYRYHMVRWRRGFGRR
jgi:GntR family transcriptional regulator